MAQPARSGRWQGTTLAGVALALLLTLLTTSSTVATEGDSDADGLSDGFETRWGVTSPTRADSDGDGLIDAAEDIDGDDLGALGEQRFGTDPGSDDSDGDGVLDGHEDSNGDGRTDAQQQDLRRVPRDLRPSLEMAWWDRPDNYDDRCHNDAVDAELHPCSFAALGSDVRVVLFGDSHALQWLPALVNTGQSEGWEIVALTKAACPPAQVEFGRKEAEAAPSCRTWRQQALTWLADEPPDLLLLVGAGRIYKLLDQDGTRLPPEAALATWAAGLARTLEGLPDATSTIVLADTPLMQPNPVTCLERNPGDISACVTPRAAAIDQDLDKAERAVAEAAGATFESLNHLVCPYDPCPVVAGDMLMWRNGDHITATFAEQLTPSMRELLLRALAQTEGADGKR